MPLWANPQRTQRKNNEFALYKCTMSRGLERSSPKFFRPDFFLKTTGKNRTDWAVTFFLNSFFPTKPNPRSYLPLFPCFPILLYSPALSFSFPKIFPFFFKTVIYFLTSLSSTSNASVSIFSLTSRPSWHSFLRKKRQRSPSR